MCPSGRYASFAGLAVLISWGVVRATQTEIEEAVEALRAGDLVVFPTETVYGLGANASNPVAVRKIFEVKGRPPDHPVIVHLDDPRYLHRWVSAVPPVAEQLAEKFWPGPLTLILPKADNVNDIVTGGQDSIGIRVPSHPMAQALLREFARLGSGAIAAPSANRSTAAPARSRRESPGRTSGRCWRASRFCRQSTRRRRC